MLLRLAAGLGIALVAFAGSSRAAGEDSAALACSADAPTVPLDGVVTVRAWTMSPASRLAWEATAGQLEAHGAEARWSFAGLQPGTYAAIVRLAGGDGGSPECLVRVVVRRDAGTRGPGAPAPAPPGTRETGWALLQPGRSEAPGYGLYSYLLLGAPPSGATRERYLAVIDAYWGLVPEIASLERYVAPAQLNIAYLPVTGPPPQAVSTEWLLAQHDHARSRALLRLLPGAHRGGPYILSVLKRVGLPGAGSSLTGPYLFQDLSSVPPNLAAAWVKQFLNQAAQERFWENRTGERLALKLRVTIGVMGTGLPEVRKALDTWIAWVR
jgi:hypothetical protein